MCSLQHVLPPPQALCRLLSCSSSKICHLQAGDNGGAASQAFGKGRGAGRKGGKGGARKEPVQVLRLCSNHQYCCFLPQCLITMLPLGLL